MASSQFKLLLGGLLLLFNAGSTVFNQMALSENGGKMTWSPAISAATTEAFKLGLALLKTGEKNKATGKIVVAGSKPAPTTLMLIPMPIDPRAKEALAATLSENNATLPIMDSGASKNTVPLWYEPATNRNVSTNRAAVGLPFGLRTAIRAQTAR